MNLATRQLELPKVSHTLRQRERNRPKTRKIARDLYEEAVQTDYETWVYENEREPISDEQVPWWECLHHAGCDSYAKALSQEEECPTHISCLELCIQRCVSCQIRYSWEFIEGRELFSWWWNADWQEVHFREYDPYACIQGWDLWVELFRGMSADKEFFEGCGVARMPPTGLHPRRWPDAEAKARQVLRAAEIAPNPHRQRESGRIAEPWYVEARRQRHHERALARRRREDKIARTHLADK